MFGKILSLLILFCFFTTFAQASPLMKIETTPVPEGNWTYIPEGSGEMKIHVTTSYAKKIKVWRVPTGTQQWVNRKLICEESGFKTDWICVWKYDKDDTIHDHFVVEVFGEDWRIQDSINVTRRHSKNHPQ
ncbi:MULTISPECIES: hypothetical protein [unclassified Paenibacillus]|uniref:hypothetical protein n=1 Tax=unclassified Paenibacillus TaxID=185978 RepID=UPI002785E839|nr:MULTISPECIES: hypothetical protein [unclassified Paenibacillus]MDQ0896444.1 hypothetical protein [Paenibacillus sp. V4I7]MDQ0914012.1 hypothetical protein [Paenibacillus sp. V4I5]